MKKRRARTPPSAQIPQASRFDETALFEFSKTINSSLDPHFIMGHILFTIMGKTLSSKGMILLAEEKKQHRVEMAKGFPQSLVGTTLDIPELPSTASRLSSLKTRRPWIQRLRKNGVEIVFPMAIAGKPLGLLCFGSLRSQELFTPSVTTFLLSLANISATAIVKSKTVEAVQQINRRLDRKIQELKTLFELGKEFGSLLEPDQVIRLLVFSILGQTGVSRYVIGLREGSEMKVVASRIDGPPPQEKLLKALCTVSHPTLVEELIVRQNVDPRTPLSAMGLRIVIPMQLKGETEGLLILGERLQGGSFGDADIEFLASLANLAMIAIENARLFKQAIEKQKMEDELLIAREIQKGLLPSVIPSIPGLEIAATNVSSKHVGGDYYDVLTTRDSDHIIAIGDVSGKGTPAALLMANLQATIRALVPMNLSLGELTARVNDLMCENTGGDKFVTFFWGAIDRHHLTYVNAGHNYPYIIRRDGSVRRLDKGGMILGVMKTETPYEEETVRLYPEDVLLLFTDGVSEAMNDAGVEYGELQLESLLHRQLPARSHEIVDAILEDVRAHSRDALQSDDITMMVVKVS